MWANDTNYTIIKNGVLDVTKLTRGFRPCEGERDRFLRAVANDQLVTVDADCRAGPADDITFADGAQLTLLGIAALNNSFFA